MQSPPLKSWLLLTALGLVWGASFMSVTLALEGFGPITVAALRISIGALALLAIARLMGVGLPSTSTPTGRRTWGFAMGMALFSNAFPFMLLSWAQQSVPSGFAGVTMAGVPLLVLPLAHVFVPGERLTLRRLLGFVVGFAGVVVLIGPENILAGGDGPFVARLACIAAAACYAIGSIITRRAPPGPLMGFSAAALLLATMLMLPMALLIEGVPDAPGVASIGAVAYLGILPTAIATIVLVHLIQTAGPSFLSLVNYQVPVWAVILGAVVLAEPVPPQTAMALGLILAGLFIARARRRKPPLPSGA
ncbi:DMT family transporter [Oceanibium sediminis]|uniref:DMT family transporter n=1 Tax=Oceanibium sediminis TaxID=2026339 RepID=UPI000DD35EF5|nr:DMT family transporter [Oceanibium sediminis]